MTRRLDLAALVVAMLFPTLAAWVYFFLLHGQEAARLAYAVAKILQFSFPVLWVKFVQGESIRPHKPSRRGLLLGLFFGILVVAGMLVLYETVLKGSPHLAETPARLWAKLDDFGVDSRARFVALAAFLSVVHSGLEEYYWRWFVFGQLRRWTPAWLAGVLSGIAFALHHVLVVAAYLPPEYFWSMTLGLSACVAVGGMVWAWLYQRTDSIYSPWLSHCLVDVGLMWIGHDLVKSYFTG